MDLGSNPQAGSILGRNMSWESGVVGFLKVYVSLVAAVCVGVASMTAEREGRPVGKIVSWCTINSVLGVSMVCSGLVIEGLILCVFSDSTVVSGDLSSG